MNQLSNNLKRLTKAGAILFGLTDYIWSYPRIMLLYWLLFGLMAAAVKLRYERN